MSIEAWVALAGLALTLIGIIIRVERRMGKALTREEHEAICKDRNLQVEKKIDSLRADMERRHEENRKSFDRIDTATTGTHELILNIYRDVLNQRGQR